MLAAGHDDDLPSRALPSHVREYFAALTLPAWADPVRLARGSEVFYRNGPLIIMLLNAYSLPLCYAAGKGVQVLARTERLQSNTNAAGKQLVTASGKRNFAAYPEGQMMTRALLEMMAAIVPGTVFDAVPAQLVRFFVGERIAHILALPDHGDTPLVQALRVVGHTGDTLGDHSALVRALARRFGGLLLDGLLLVSRGGQRLPFNIPTELRQVWGVNWQ